MNGGRLTIELDAISTITVARRPELAGRDPDDLLREAVAEAGDRVLDHGMRTLGVYPAAYLLEAVPDEEGNGSTYHARYLTVAGDSGYEVVCSVVRMHERDFWERHWRPICERVLETVRLGTVP